MAVVESIETAQGVWIHRKRLPGDLQLLYSAFLFLLRSGIIEATPVFLAVGLVQGWES